MNKEQRQAQSAAALQEQQKREEDEALEREVEFNNILTAVKYLDPEITSAPEAIGRLQKAVLYLLERA